MTTESNRKTVLISLLCAMAALAVTSGAQKPGNSAPSQVSGRFQPSWESLKQYRCPDWFRDAKFGIWAHWTAQCVPEQGDWYARAMYEEGSPDYKYQVERYGHPSKVGFKEIDHLWHAERWDPEKLMQLYVRAGAHYFVALANHHDNFDTWNSRYQPWNSVNIGPHKDIIAGWAAAARRHGLRFGVTVHAARTWDWFDVSHGSDKTGPLAGVPYDGNLTKADGKGQWWEGLDPADLYGPAGAARTPAAHAAYERKFYNRVMDLLTGYHPDLLYFDDGEPPTAYGLQIAANFYNLSAGRHGEGPQAVLNVKDASERVKQSMVLDYERGRSDRISPQPWQTDTCIGDWHYRRSLYENHQYKTAHQVIRMLADIVSKNGNLLLNIPVRGDGTIDEDEVKFLQGMAAWMDVNKEAIFGTRPWKIAGEGPVRVRGGGFSEGGEDRFTAEDFRFTTKGGALYAVALGWPESGKLTVKTLAAHAPGIVGDVTDVQLLGSKERLAWVRTQNGLEVTLPARRPCDHAWTLKIAGLDLANSAPVPPDTGTVHADKDGSLTLGADAATLHGERIQIETRAGGANIGFWDNADDSVSWAVDIPQPGAYEVSARYASLEAGAFVVEAGGKELGAEPPGTGSWDAFQTLVLGRMEFAQAGKQVVKVRSRDAATWKAINLASIKLTRIE